MLKAFLFNNFPGRSPLNHHLDPFGSGIFFFGTCSNHQRNDRSAAMFSPGRDDLVSPGHKLVRCLFLPEKKLLLISINFTPKNQPQLLKKMVHYVFQVGVFLFMKSHHFQMMYGVAENVPTQPLWPSLTSLTKILTDFYHCSWRFFEHLDCFWTCYSGRWFFYNYILTFL